MWSVNQILDRFFFLLFFMDTNWHRCVPNRIHWVKYISIFFHIKVEKWCKILFIFVQFKRAGRPLRKPRPLSHFTNTSNNMAAAVRAASLRHHALQHEYMWELKGPLWVCNIHLFFNLSVIQHCQHLATTTCYAFIYICIQLDLPEPIGRGLAMSVHKLRFK